MGNSSKGNNAGEISSERERRRQRVEDAKRAIENTQWERAPLPETELILHEYLDEHGKLISLERTILEITKANFTAFGAILLVGSSSFFVTIADGQSVASIACLIVAFVSLASSVLVVFYYKYVVAYSRKVSILRKGAWRQRPFAWLDVKYDAEEVLEKFEDANKLGILEFITYKHVMKWVNLIPLAVVLLIALLIFLGFFVPPAPRP